MGREERHETLHFSHLWKLERLDCAIEAERMPYPSSNVCQSCPRHISLPSGVAHATVSVISSDLERREKKEKQQRSEKVI